MDRGFTFSILTPSPQRTASSNNVKLSNYGPFIKVGVQSARLGGNGSHLIVLEMPKIAHLNNTVYRLKHTWTSLEQILNPLQGEKGDFKRQSVGDAVLSENLDLQ